MVHQIEQRGVLQGGVCEICARQSCAGGSGLSAKEETERGIEEGQRRAVTEIQNRRLSHDCGSGFRRRKDWGHRLRGRRPQSLHRRVGKNQKEVLKKPLPAILALEDGSLFHGQGFGAPASVCGEVCFNTSMTGYQEILTDPSYKGQIVAMTYPLIGNCGVNEQDIESWRPHVAGFVIRELSPVVSNWRADCSLDEYLEKNGLPGIQGVDTRALTKKLRVRGALKGFISTKKISDAEAVERAKNWTGLVGVDYVKEVTHKEAFLWDEKDQQSGRFNLANGNKSADPRNIRDPLPPADIPIVAYDFGMKYN